jgi:hypothetical protein
MAFLFALFVFAPSVASAQTVVGYNALSARVCTQSVPGPVTCTTYTGTQMMSQLETSGMPIELAVYCTNQNQWYCSAQTPQYIYGTYKNTGGYVWGGPWYYFATPSKSTSLGLTGMTPGGLAVGCKQDALAYYECTAGIGGSWGEWVITVYY